MEGTMRTYVGEVHFWVNDKEEMKKKEYPTKFMKTGEITKLPFLFAYYPDFEFESNSNNMEMVCNNMRHIVADNAISNLMAHKITDLVSKPGMSVFVDLCINRQKENNQLAYIDPHNHTYQFRFRL